MIGRLVCAIQFLTRLPTPGVKTRAEDFARSMAFFPLVGLLIGFFLYGTYLLGGIVLAPEVVAALVILMGVAVSGALHLDGFMDTMDGLFCGRTRERRLEILRDSRVGAHSVVSVVVLLLLKWSLLLQLQQGPQQLIMPALLVMPVVSRLNMVLATYWFPYIRKEGLGKAMAGSLKMGDVVFAVITTFAIAYYLLNFTGVAVALAVVATAMLAAKAISNLLGGLTGDVYGWLNETSEVAWLLLIISIAEIW